MFFRYSLRTADLGAAIAFYRDAIGLRLHDSAVVGTADGSALEAWTLHERARAMGAPPHWLGHLAVDDVEAMATRLVSLGAERLGPTIEAAGATYATLRDPLGAVISVRAEANKPNDQPVAWHQLHTRDAETAWAMYTDLFGWVHKDTLDVPDPVGGHRLFSWSKEGVPIGSVANTGRWPGVHPHWLFHFPVADIEAATSRVRTGGGNARDIATLKSGVKISVCEDPQGAAFGLISIPADR